MKPDAGATRREFLSTAAAAGALLTAGGVYVNAAEQPARGPNDRIGVGFIGAGGRADSHMHAVNYLKTQKKMNLELAAVCDVYRPRLQRAAQSLKAKPYMDHRELLADPSVDVVCIATPDHVHGQQVIDAVRAGKDVYCEKPITHWRQFDLTKRMAAEVKKSGRVFQSGTQGMSDWAWHQIRKLIADGLIGQPIHADCGYFRVGDWGERGMPIDDPNAKPGPDLNWEAFLGDTPKRDFDVSRFFRWRMYEDYAGGPVTDLYPHTFTAVASMLGVGFPSQVVATGGMFRYTEREVPDTFNMLIDYPQKITVALMGTQGNNDPTTPQRGATGRIPVIRGWEGSVTLANNKEILFRPAEGSKKKEQRFPIDHGEDFILFWETFLDCCRKRDPNTLAPIDLAYHVQTAMIMGAWSAKQGKVARFDTAKEEMVM